MRFRATEGALSISAHTGVQSALLLFNIDEGDSGKSLRDGLRGFVLQRTGKDGSIHWIGDPRAGKKATDSCSAAPSSPPVQEAPNQDERLRFALRRPIQCFKWGEYALQPGTDYEYTLFAIHGEPEATAAVQGQMPFVGPGLYAKASVKVHVQTPAREELSHGVYFNRAVAGSQRFAQLFPGASELCPREPAQWAWLSGGLSEALLAFLRRAEGRGWALYCALYEAHYMPVVQELADARDRGVTVRVIVDWKPGAWSDSRKTWTPRGPQHLNWWAFQEAGLLPTPSTSRRRKSSSKSRSAAELESQDTEVIIFRTKPLTAISHNKFFILASVEDPDKPKPLAVWTGSTNITAGAIYGHSNVGHVVHDEAVCQQYMDYWQELQYDPDKKDIAKHNEEISPLPNSEDSASVMGLKPQDCKVLFGPRIDWLKTLDFVAQLIYSAKQCVCFTAAFGISKEISPALLSGAVPKYLLLESEGNWASSRDAVHELQKRQNVRVAFGSHIEGSAGFHPEGLTGLNMHVKYIHTKILIVDPFSESPIVVSGSANFSRSSMENNDENMLIVRGNKQVADSYAVEFFRLFEHMYFRNQLDEGRQGGDGKIEKTKSGLCRCGMELKRSVCQKPGANQGRPFAACAKPMGQQCGLFRWESEEDVSMDPTQAPKVVAWPQVAFEESCFEYVERKLLDGCGAPQTDQAAGGTGSSQTQREPDLVPSYWVRTGIVEVTEDTEEDVFYDAIS